MKLELFYPIKNPKIITQAFGQNLVPYYQQLGYKGHTGIDMVGMHDQIVRAAHDGIVTYAGTDANEGWGIVIRTEDERTGIDGKPSLWKTVYWHLVANSFLVKVGDKVRCGQPIARCGNTGTWGSTTPGPECFAPIWKGNHLHFGLKPIAAGENDWTWTNSQQSNGYAGALNPQPYFNGLYAEDYISISDKLILLFQKVADIFKLLNA
mgnify:CR=1 FL=1